MSYLFGQTDGATPFSQVKTPTRRELSYTLGGIIDIEVVDPWYVPNYFKIIPRICIDF